MSSAPPDIILKNRKQRVVTKLGPDKTFLVRAEIQQGLSSFTDIDLQFVANDINLDISKIVGQQVTIEMDHSTNDGKGTEKTRYFHGWCIECAYEDTMGGLALFRAELRPWFWFLTLARNSRIFQNMTVIDIIKKVLGDHNFSGDVEMSTRGSYPSREFTVQYRENDFDFLSRLMEENGIYWYTKDETSKQKIVFADDVQAHKPLTDAATIDFMEPEEGDRDKGQRSFRRTKDHIYEFSIGETVRTGKVTLKEYDFKRQKVVQAVSAIPKGSHNNKSYEDYDWPGSYDPEEADDDGKRVATVRMEAHGAPHLRSTASGNVPTMAAGGTFTLKEHDRKELNAEYLVVRARHFLQLEVDEDKKGQASSQLDALLDVKELQETYRNEIVLQQTKVPFRAPQVTPWPSIPGIQTAIVVGKKGEEIFTDEYGRVKVQFHWDRDGKNDDNSSCFVRCAVPWSGNGWGMQWIPRMGQEVVVQFEDGDPDKPVITGMLFNGVKKPAEAWSDNKTMTGIRTNSSKGGGGYHELMFEDKKDAEFVRFQSERDFYGLVKNNYHMDVGVGHKDKGDYSLNIHNDMNTMLLEGNRNTVVEQGWQRNFVRKDNTVIVEGGETVDVSKKKDDTIGQSYTVDVGQTMTIKAKQKIVLQCGQSKIEMTPSAIKITSMNIEQKGQMNFKAEGGMQMALKGGMKLQAEGGMQMQLKGGMQWKAEGGLMSELKGGLMCNVKGGLMTSVKSDLMTQIGGAILMIK